MAIILTKADTGRICDRFGIPEAGASRLRFFFDEDELSFILAVENGAVKEPFTAEDTGTDFIQREYHKGLISKTDETGKSYHLNDFYGFLDVFCVSDTARYKRLPVEERRALDDWYFKAYLDRLNTRSRQPTPDRVVPLEEMLELIDKDNRPVYLNYCDCRSLTGECGFMTRTCITYRTGINSFVDRGLSERIDKERAKAIVREADAAGLMHTSAMGGICNCCGDCCYLFKGQRALHSTGIWPASAWIISFDKEKCIGCGRCRTRCHFSVFEKRDREIAADPVSCVGCGLCVNTCPAGALTLTIRGEGKE